MSMLKCPKCDNEISDKARVCPHCGRKRKGCSIIRNIVFIFSIITSFFMSIIALLVMFSVIIDIKEITYPLTAMLPIVACLTFIAFNVYFLFSMNKYRKRQKCKKHFIVSLVLLIASVCIYFLCAPINIAIQKNNIFYQEQGNSTYYIKGLSYEVPKKWRTSEIEEGNYHYPYTQNSKGLLYVYALYDIDFDISLYDNLNDYYEAFMSEIKESDDTGYFKMISQESTKIAGKDGFRSKYKILLSNNYLECEQFLVLDFESHTMYVFYLGIKDSIPNDISEIFQDIIKSIKER